MFRIRCLTGQTERWARIFVTTRLLWRCTFRREGMAHWFCTIFTKWYNNYAPVKDARLPYVFLFNYYDAHLFDVMRYRRSNERTSISNMIDFTTKNYFHRLNIWIVWSIWWYETISAKNIKMNVEHLIWNTV